MVILSRIFVVIVLLWVFFYTASFGWWTWKKKNKLGAVMVFILALTSVVLPVYSLFFKE